MRVLRITRAENRGQSAGSSTVIGNGVASPVVVGALLMEERPLLVEERPFRAASGPFEVAALAAEGSVGSSAFIGNP